MDKDIYLVRILYSDWKEFEDTFENLGYCESYDEARQLTDKLQEKLSDNGHDLAHVEVEVLKKISMDTYNPVFEFEYGIAFDGPYVSYSEGAFNLKESTIKEHNSDSSHYCPDRSHGYIYAHSAKEALEIAEKIYKGEY